MPKVKSQPVKLSTKASLKDQSKPINKKKEIVKPPTFAKGSAKIAKGSIKINAPQKKIEVAKKSKRMPDVIETRSQQLGKVISKAQIKKVVKPVKAIATKKIEVKKSQHAAAKAAPQKKAKVADEKKPTDQILPKKPSGPYNFFIIEMSKKIREQQPSISFSEISKKMAEAWKNMKDADKLKYEKQVIADKQRYEQETSMLEKKGYFINANGENSKDLYRIKNQTMPKRAMTAYFCYAVPAQAQLRKTNPSLKITENCTLVAQNWGKLTDEQKKPYVELHQQDQLRYQNELKQLQTKGFFVNKDGIKSTDIIKKVKRDRSKVDKKKDSKASSDEVEIVQIKAAKKVSKE